MLAGMEVHGTLPEPPSPPLDVQDPPLDRKRSWPSFFMKPRDIGLFLASAQTDAEIARIRESKGARAAFEAVYSRHDDPWAAASPLYRYQRRKYEHVVSLLPRVRFQSALDVGCGLGLLAQLVAPRVDELLGVDIAQAAIDRARERSRALPHVKFERADLLDLPRTFDGRFDLLLLVDTIYYLSPLHDQLLKRIAMRAADLLAPGGLCVLVNHYFFAIDPDSRLSRRIHRAFAWSPRFRSVSDTRKPFFLASLLVEQSDVRNAEEADA